MQSAMQSIIFVLELENNKYYIGRTYVEFSNNTASIPALLTNSTHEWHKLHKPLKILEYIAQIDIFDITRLVLKYMAKHGIDNVRGGCFSEVILPYSDYIVLHKMIREHSETCIYCNLSTHTYKECPYISLTGRLLKKEKSEYTAETEDFTIVSKDEHGNLIITQEDLGIKS